LTRLAGQTDKSCLLSLQQKAHSQLKDSLVAPLQALA